MKNVIQDKFKKNVPTDPTCSETYIVHADGVDESGLELKTGGKYRILSSDGDAVLIEKIGDENNPYIASWQFLEPISVVIPTEGL